METKSLSNVTKLIVTTWMLSLCSYSLADVVTPSLDIPDSPSPVLGAQSGHRIDPLKGFANFRNVDLTVPGNGGMLPIVVSRILDVERSSPALRVPQELGNWDLEIPRLTAWRGIYRSDGVTIPYASTPAQWSAGYCNNPVYTQNMNHAGYDLYYWHGITLDIPGDGPRKLIFAKQNVNGQEVVVYPQINVINGVVKGNVKYATVDNWKAECIDLPQGARSGFKVSAPNGIKYTFDTFSSPRSTRNENWGWWHSLGAYVYPSKVEDPSGNWLAYEYESDSNEGLHVSQITASDGRRVRFIYEAFDYTQHPFWAPKSTVKRLIRVEHLNDAGSSVIATVEYGYNHAPSGPDKRTETNRSLYSLIKNPNANLYYPQPFTQKSHGTLAYARTPDGKYWSYSYQNFRDWVDDPANPNDKLSWDNDTDMCDWWTPFGWNCGPSYSTLSVMLTGVTTPQNAYFQYSYVDDDPYQILTDRAKGGLTGGYHTWGIRDIFFDTDQDGLAESIHFEYRERPIAPDGIHYAQCPQTDNEACVIRTIRYPWNRVDKYYYHRSNTTSTNSSGWPVTLSLKGGLLGRQEIYDAVNSTETLLKSTDYRWNKPREVGDNSSDCWSLYCNKPDQWTTTLLSQNSTLNGASSSVEYSNFDIYGHPRLVKEYSPAGRIRSTDLTVVNDEDSWILGLTTQRTIDGVGIISSTFNTKGQLESHSNFGLTHTFEYHSTGDVYKEKWKRTAGGPDIAQVFEQYKRGVPRKVTDPLGNFMTRVVNDDGTVGSETNARGFATSFAYDSMRRPTTVSPPGARTPTVTDWFQSGFFDVRNTTGNLVQVTRLDNLGRPRWKSTEDNRYPITKSYTSYSYDKAGRTAFVSRPANYSGYSMGESTTFDALNRPVEIRDTASGHVTRLCYGPACNAARPGRPPVGFGYVVTDADGFETIHNFDQLGPGSGLVPTETVRQVSTSPLRYVTTTFMHNLIDQVTQIAQSGVIRTREYNSKMLLWRSTEPETGQTIFGYDEAGNLVSTQVGSNPTLMNVFDNANALREINPNTPGVDKITFNYDENGNLRDVGEGGVVRLRTYDANDLLETETLKTPGSELKLLYGRDALGNVSSIQYPTGMSLQYAPNALGNATTAWIFQSSFVQTLATNFIYYPSGNISQFNYGNGLTFKRVEDTRGLLRQLRVETPQIVPRMDINYGYDGRRNVTNVTDNVDSTSNKVLSYDGLSRLESSVSAGGNESFAYDDVGNMRTISRAGTTTTLNYNSNNLLYSASDGRSFGYDSFGNISSNGQTSLLFNSLGQLRSVQRGTYNRNYFYDGNHYRAITREGKNDTLSFYSSAGKLMTEINRRTGETKDYYYLGAQLLAVAACSRTETDSDGDTIPDCFERRWGMNPNNAADAGGDMDGDGVTNLQEYQAGYDPKVTDSDGDGMPDGFEYRFRLDALWNDSNEDPDRDGLTNLQEFQRGTSPQFNPAWLTPILDILLQ